MKLLALRKRLPWLDRLVGYAVEFSPYLTIELLLPGGSVVALLLWLHRRIHRRSGAEELPGSQTIRPHCMKPGCHDIKP
jgi:hypothetical protein